MCCKKCESQNIIKSGFVKGQQRYKCKNCCFIKVSNVPVLNWVRKYALENYEKPAPKGEAVIIELNEMWHFIKSKKQVVDNVFKW